MWDSVCPRRATAMAFSTRLSASLHDLLTEFLLHNSNETSKALTHVGRLYVGVHARRRRFHLDVVGHSDGAVF